MTDIPNNPIYQTSTTPPALPQATRHSGFGIASFIISLAAAVGLFLLVVIAGVMEASAPGGIDEESAGAIFLGLMIFGAIGIDLLALLFGIIGVLQKDRKKIFSILGIVFSAFSVAGIASLMMLGLAAQ